MKRRTFLSSLLAIPAAATILSKVRASEIQGISLKGPQAALYDAKEQFILAWGNKYCGKSYAALHKLVHHCWANDGAMALIVVAADSLATHGGTWTQLRKTILPEWKESMGLEYSAEKRDSNYDRMFWIKTVTGSWSLVWLIAEKDAEKLRRKVRGTEPSFVFAPEIDHGFSDEMFQVIAAQLGRRRGIEHQQFVGEARPYETNWIYRQWFVDNEPVGSKFSRAIFFPIA